MITRSVTQKENSRTLTIRQQKKLLSISNQPVITGEGKKNLCFEESTTNYIFATNQNSQPQRQIGLQVLLKLNGPLCPDPLFNKCQSYWTTEGERERRRESHSNLPSNYRYYFLSADDLGICIPLLPLFLFRATHCINDKRGFHNNLFAATTFSRVFLVPSAISCVFLTAVNNEFALFGIRSPLRQLLACPVEDTRCFCTSYRDPK